jgi:uncharacterized protein YacL (UPF0231 family)
MRGQKVKFDKDEKHGRLTVIGPLNKTLQIGKRGVRCLWAFKCDCGSYVECIGSDVKAKRKQSCGCLFEEHKAGCGKRLSIVNTKPNKEGPINKLFGAYERAAKSRGYEWLLSKDEFSQLIAQNCFYCGGEPKSKYTTCSKHPVNDNVLIYNGVDRKENNIGYTKENCITACGVCNRMKMDLDYNAFIQQITKIYNTQKHYE